MIKYTEYEVIEKTIQVEELVTRYDKDLTEKVRWYGQQKLADRMGVSKGYINRVVLGRCNISKKRLEEIRSIVLNQKEQHGK